MQARSFSHHMDNSNNPRTFLSGAGADLAYYQSTAFRRVSTRCDIEDLRIFTVTWNVAGFTPDLSNASITNVGLNRGQRNGGKYQEGTNIKRDGKDDGKTTISGRSESGAGLGRSGDDKQKNPTSSKNTDTTAPGVYSSAYAATSSNHFPSREVARTPEELVKQFFRESMPADTEVSVQIEPLFVPLTIICATGP